jgi:hypothetical protein
MNDSYLNDEDYSGVQSEDDIKRILKDAQTPGPNKYNFDNAGHEVRQPGKTNSRRSHGSVKHLTQAAGQWRAGVEMTSMRLVLIVLRLRLGSHMLDAGDGVVMHNNNSQRQPYSAISQTVRLVANECLLPCIEVCMCVCVRRPDMRMT